MMFCWDTPIPVEITTDLMLAIFAHAQVGIAGANKAFALEV